jgi:hypothetical protein
MKVVGAGLEDWGGLVAAGGGRQVRRQVEFFYEADTYNQSFNQRDLTRNKMKETPSLTRPSPLVSIFAPPPPPPVPFHGLFCQIPRTSHYWDLRPTIFG